MKAKYTPIKKSTLIGVLILTLFMPATIFLMILGVNILYIRDIDEFEFIIRQLNRFRSWTWRQIETSFNGTSCGMMNIDILDEKRMISEHLESICRSDVDVLYKMEINNHHRVWGIREDSCLFLIWNARSINSISITTVTTLLRKRKN